MARFGPAVACFLTLMLLPHPTRAQLQTSIAPPALPSLNAPDTGKSAEKSADDPDATYCRPPQHRTDSMLMGPKVCMTNKQWDALRASGFDIGPDGSKVSMEKHLDMLSH
jgi:hypothetical protein